jgi:hypothetical protein
MAKIPLQTQTTASDYDSEAEADDLALIALYQNLLSNADNETENFNLDNPEGGVPENENDHESDNEVINEASVSDSSGEEDFTQYIPNSNTPVSEDEEFYAQVHVVNTTISSTSNTQNALNSAVQGAAGNESSTTGNIDMKNFSKIYPSNFSSSSEYDADSSDSDNEEKKNISEKKKTQNPTSHSK